MERGGARYSIATDQVGTPRVVTDARGTVVKALEFDSFGVALSDSAPGFFLPFGFAGGLADPATGLVRFGMRDYEPETGRWTARDPALFGGGQANLYLYAGGDPVGQRDPTGLVCLGGSVYAGFGGGAQLCITDEGMSLCAEAGFGVGTDAGIGLGDLADTGTSVVAEISAKLGPLGVGAGLELDSSGCLRGDKPKITTPIGDISADGYKPPGLGADVEVNGKDLAFKSGRASVQAKVAAKACGKLTF
jgi:RHS repeat-associated protein